MENSAKHIRTFGLGDGVADEVAIVWSDLEAANRRAGVVGKHRAEA